MAAVIPSSPLIDVTRAQKVMIEQTKIPLGVLAWLIWPFWQLAGQFGTHPTKQPSRLYGRPFELRAEAALGAEALVARLGEAGYRRVGSPESLRPGSFFAAAAGDAVEVFRRRFPTAAGADGGDRLEVRFRGRTKTEFNGKENVTSFYAQPKTIIRT